MTPLDSSLTLPDLPAGDTLVSVEVAPFAVRILEVLSAEAKILAVHEAGHCAVAAITGVPLVATSIEGRHSGETLLGIGNADQLSFETLARLEDRIAVSLAGAVAEETIFGQWTTCGERDVHDATGLCLLIVRSGLGGDEVPFIAWGPFQYDLGIPEVLRTQVTDFVQKTLIAQRTRVRLMLTEHKDSVLTFAGRLHQERRLDVRAGLDEALREAGLPVRPRD